MERTLILLCLLVSAMGVARAEVVGKEVDYSSGDTRMKGYIAYDDAYQGKRPGVLVVHEWWGHNAYARHRAGMLAKLGYTALAVDMYGDGKVAQHPDEAGKFAAEVSKNMPLAKARFEAAIALLRAQDTVDAKTLAAIGYCFGGGVVLNMARQGEPLKAVVSFHGALGTDTPAQAGRVKSHILIFSGEDDPMIGADKVAAFRQEMKAAGADFHVVTYPGVKHSFTNPDADELGKRYKLPLAYDAAADHDSWQQATDFLKGELSH